MLDGAIPAVLNSTGSSCPSVRACALSRGFGNCWWLSSSGLPMETVGAPQRALWCDCTERQAHRRRPDPHAERELPFLAEGWNLLLSRQDPRERQVKGDGRVAMR